jgi:hypothetical protein
MMNDGYEGFERRWTGSVLRDSHDILLKRPRKPIKSSFRIAGNKTELVAGSQMLTDE